MDMYFLISLKGLFKMYRMLFPIICVIPLVDLRILATVFVTYRLYMIRRELHAWNLNTHQTRNSK